MVKYFGLFLKIKELGIATVSNDIYSGFHAQVYDYYKLHNADIDIYIKLAKKNPGLILDLGTGTGRIALPLIQNGFQVTGVDISQDMLNILKQKVLGKAYENNLNLILGDMLDLKLNQKFALIILGATNISMIGNKEQRLRLFEMVKNHLSHTGCFVFDFEEFDKPRSTEEYYFLPHYQKNKKGFTYIGQKIQSDDKYCLINMYSEVIHIDSRTDRYLSGTIKYILNKNEILEELNHVGLVSIGTYNNSYKIGEKNYNIHFILSTLKG